MNKWIEGFGLTGLVMVGGGLAFISIPLALVVVGTLMISLALAASYFKRG